MATKKTTSKTKKTTKKPTTKSSASKKKTPTKKTLVEKKLSSVLDTDVKKSEKKSKKAKFPVWGLFSVLLLLLFAVLVWYEYNGDFKNNVNKLIKPAQTETQEQKQEQKGQDEVVAEGEESLFPMTIVYNEGDAEQRAKIEGYLSNVEMNLQNTNMEVTWYDKDSAEGQDLIAKTEAKFLPIFVTNDSVKNHPQYGEFAPALTPKDDVLVIMSEGLEYLEVPAVGDAQVIGAAPEAADVVIIEYASLSCGFCKQMHPIIQNVVDANPGTVSWVIKNFDRGGPDMTLAQAAECAAEQGAYIEMVDALYEAQSDVFAALGDTDNPDAALDTVIADAAAAAGINANTLSTCIEANTYADLVTAQSMEGREFGVLGTPSFFVNDQFVPGAISQEELDSLVEAELS